MNRNRKISLLMSFVLVITPACSALATPVPRDLDNCADFNQRTNRDLCSVLSTDHSLHNELQRFWEIARLCYHGSDTRYLEQ